MSPVIAVTFSQQTQMVKMNFSGVFYNYAVQTFLNNTINTKELRMDCFLQQIQLVLKLFLLEILLTVIFGLGFTIVRNIWRSVNVGKGGKK